MSQRTELRVDSNGPFDFQAAFDTLVAHRIEGLHQLTTNSWEFTRLEQIGDEAHLITVRLDHRGAVISSETQDEDVNSTVAQRVRHWFDFDTDLDPINQHLGADPVFAAQVKARPGIRITRFQAPFEAVILTVLGQQVSLAAGRLFGARLVAAYSPPPTHSGLRLFPAPASIAATTVDELRAAIGLTNARARTVHEVAVLFAEQDNHAVLPSREQLHQISGIGPWTLDYLAIRASTNPDAFPASDAVLKRTLAANITDNSVQRIQSWAPYRSYAATRLWALSS
ncbi:DNA-3-methyladenine glycosylase family protein [Corynebacterium lubricantis]|uniref:DNA-3-methyladenine glycosylase family protein n=1 Tax=Corynebacterium lubricantis TaxID=541095 RepID=UPI00037EAA0B|nr:AlkA N-terminal domain-containing protein [Corynebacterium lubricantis]